MSIDKTSNNILLIGLPGSGKSTFTAALWGVVKSTSNFSSLKVRKFTGDATYLNGIYTLWSDAQIIPRTNFKTEGNGVFDLCERENESSSLGELVIPDLTGERFSKQWEERIISEESHGEYLDKVDGILLFIHSRKIDRGIVVNSAKLDDVVDAVFGEDDNEDLPVKEEDKGDDENLPDIEEPFNSKKSPTQAKLVDIIQTTLIEGKKIRKIAIVISAWDLVEDKYSTPSKWLTNEMPFLSQYLNNNDDIFEYYLWGVSAQGGNLEKEDGSIDEDVQDKLLKFMRPEERVSITDGESEDKDLTTPIKWLFSH